MRELSEAEMTLVSGGYGPFGPSYGGGSPFWRPFVGGHWDTWNNDGTWQPDADGDGQGDTDQMQQALEDAGYTNVVAATNTTTGNAGFWANLPGSEDSNPNDDVIEVNAIRVWINTPNSLGNAPFNLADWVELDANDGGYITIADDLSGSLSRNPVFNITPVDGATYWVPSHINAQYIEDAIAYLQELPMHARIAAFWDMYTDINHPHFMDIKDFRSGGQITYFSESLGRNVTSSAYEPFGNFLYGYVGVRGGIPVDVLMAAAAATQHGRFFTDDPADRPFVQHGIQTAQQVMNGTPALPDPRPPAVLDEPINPRETGVPADISQTPLDRAPGGD